MNKALRIIIIVLFMTVIVFVNNSVYASENPIRRVEEDVHIFRNESSKTHVNVDGIINELVGIGQILTFVGSGVFVAAIAYMGIKYMTTKSPEKQASLKIQLVRVAGIRDSYFWRL